jgi:L-fuconolactonase
MEYSRRTFLDSLATAFMADPAAGSPNYHVIDPHVHVWKHDPEFPFAAGAHVPARDATPEMLLGLMKANSVQRTVIIQVIHYRYDNGYLASVLKQYPQYFKGVARVDPLDPASPDHLSRLVEENGFQGVRLSPGAEPSGEWIDGPLMLPLWKRCEALRVPMTILAPIARMTAVGRLIDQCPDLTLVIDHMADCPVDRPQELDSLIALKRHPRTFVKTSHAWSLSKQKYPWLDAQNLVQRLYAAFGPRRLMWATDWPIIENSGATYAQALTLVRDDMKFLNENDKQWMLSKTISQVWPFEGVPG